MRLSIACSFVSLFAVSSDIPPPIETLPTSLIVVSSPIAEAELHPTRRGIMDLEVRGTGDEGRLVDGERGAREPMYFDGRRMDAGDERGTLDRKGRVVGAILFGNDTCWANVDENDDAEDSRESMKEGGRTMKGDRVIGMLEISDGK